MTFHEEFPLARAGDIVTDSEMTPEYNCVGWALHLKRSVIWPDDDQQHQWAPDLPRRPDKDIFCAFFEKMGFSECNDENFEQSREKIAIYSRGNEVLHVARQLRDGRWTSKLGPLADVLHPTALSISDGWFGVLAILMSREWTGGPPRIPPLHPPPARLVTPSGGTLVR